MVSLSSLFQILDIADSLDAVYWIDGGWALDAMAGRQQRDHNDLDIDFERRAMPAVLAAYQSAGFQVKMDRLPVRIELEHPTLGELDIHPFELLPDGQVRQTRPNGNELVFDPQWTRNAVLEGRTIPRVSTVGKKIYISELEQEESRGR